MTFFTRSFLGMIFLTCSIQAVDIHIDNVQSVEDITARLPVSDEYNLVVRMAGSVATAARTAILDQALQDARAIRIVHLDLRNNQLATTPRLDTLLSLQRLSLSGNNLQQPIAIPHYLANRLVVDDMSIPVAIFHSTLFHIEPRNLSSIEFFDDEPAGDAAFNFFSEPVEVVTTNTRSADDIIRRLPDNGNPFVLHVTLAQDIPSDQRTLILNQALAHPSATAIVELYLGRNELIQPPVVSRLIHLQALDLSGNRLVQSPDLTGLRRLERLHLSENELTQPPVLTDLAQLRVLGLAYNRLTRPPILTGLHDLETLSLYENNLTEPPVLDGLVRLRELFLSHNQLTRAPSLYGLPQLTTLNLSENQITKPVIIPLRLADRLDTQHIGAPFSIGAPTNLVDIATPQIDSTPFFFTQQTINQLAVPKKNPLTRRDIEHTMNLAESWQYWSAQGLSQGAFDAKLREEEPVLLESGVYTIEPDTAEAFMRLRGLTAQQRATVLARLPGDNSKVVDLLDLIIEQTTTQRLNEPTQKRQRR